MRYSTSKIMFCSSTSSSVFAPSLLCAPSTRPHTTISSQTRKTNPAQPRDRDPPLRVPSRSPAATLTSACQFQKLITETYHPKNSLTAATHNMSNLLALFLQEAPEVLHTHVLTRLNPTDLAMFARCNRAYRAAAVDSELPRAGTSAEVPLDVKRFLRSLEKIEWAKNNGLPWTAKTCARMVLLCPSATTALGWPTSLAMLQWARERNIPWDATTFNNAALCGSQELLEWLWNEQCPWDNNDITMYAVHNPRAREVMQWLRDYGYQWHLGLLGTCASAALRGNLGLLQWLREPEQQCPWDAQTLIYARLAGHDEVYQWALANGCTEEDD